MDSFICKVHLGSLKPVDQAGLDILAKIGQGMDVVIAIKRARNSRQHRLYWALMSLIYPQQERYATVEQLSNAIKCAVGWCDEIPLKRHRVMAIPKSISFANMKQADFEEFFDKVINLVVTKILPGVEQQDLKDRLSDMVGIS